MNTTQTIPAAFLAHIDTLRSGRQGIDGWALSGVCQRIINREILNAGCQGGKPAPQHILDMKKMLRAAARRWNRLAVA